MAAKRQTGMSSPWTAAAIGLLVLLGGLAYTTADDAPARPRPFDPLSEAEQEQAVETALHDAQVRLLLGGHHEVIGAALATDKDRLLDDPTSRWADLWIYDYTNDHTVHAVVDLREGTLVQVTVSNIQPPLNLSEAERAAQLARDDEDVQNALAHHATYDSIEPMVRLWSQGEGTGCETNRCVLVGFLIDGEYEAALHVHVNLSTNTVLGILEGDATEQDRRHAHPEVTP